MPRVSDIVVKTEAIALLLYPFSQHSRVVVWLSPDRGRVVTVIKGACVEVMGRLRNYRYTDSSGAERTMMEVLAREVTVLEEAQSTL